LIHAATMVAAGVYLMVRVAPLLAHAPQVGAAVLAIGVLTSLLAGTMALVESDIKRVLAFSTVSQLGMMMAAVGCGAPGAAYFHLLTHAFFKALLFLVAGGVIHAVHTNDLFKMGRLARAMPLTAACFAIGALALAGVIPTAGFFSKDEILAGVLASGHPVAFALLVVNAALTAFYIGRAFFLSMAGGNPAASGAHDPPALMTAPLVVLASLALVGGVLAPVVPRLLAGSIAPPLAEHEAAPLFVPLLGTLAALSGLTLAWLGYQRGAFDPAAIRRAAGPVTILLERRYYIDDLVELLYRRAYLGLSTVVGWFDRYVLDGLVNASAWATWRTAGRLRRIQSGRVQDALYAVAAGLTFLAWMALSR